MAARLEDPDFDPFAAEEPHQYGSVLLSLERYAEAVDLFTAGFESNSFAEKFRMEAAQAAVLAAEATPPGDRRAFLVLGLDWTAQVLSELEAGGSPYDEGPGFVVAVKYRPEWEILRDPAVLEVLGENSRADWQALWGEVDALLEEMWAE